MEAYLKSILEPVTKSPITLKNRVSYISQLHRTLDAISNDLSFLNNKDAVMKLVRSSENLGTQKTRLFHITETIKADPSNAVQADVKTYYQNEANKLKEPVRALENNNIINAKQKAKHIDIDDATTKLDDHIANLFKQYGLPESNVISGTNYNRLNTGKDRNNIYTFAKSLQEALIAALYVYQPALRNDWVDLKITRSIAPSDKNKQNWLQIKKNGSMNLILNDYKNYSSMGKQVIPINEKISKLMKYWLSILQNFHDHLRIDHPFYWSINASKNEFSRNKSSDTFAKQLGRISKKLFGVEATINSFRHAHEMKLQSSPAYQTMTQGQKRDAHAKLLHSLETGQRYNLLDRE